MSKTELPLADRIAMALGGGLILIGIAAMGLINVVGGAPHVPIEEEGAVVATPIVAPELRALLVAAGLAVWFGYALYRVTDPPTGIDRSTVPADD